MNITIITQHTIYVRDVHHSVERTLEFENVDILTIADVINALDEQGALTEFLPSQ